MADVKITGLPTSSALNGSEVVPIVQAGTTKQATVNQIVTKVDSYTKTESNSALSLKQDKLSEGAFVDGDKTKLDGIESGANGSPIDLTGAILTFSYREGSTLHSIDGTITDATNGIVEFIPSASDFQIVGSFAFDIQRNQYGYTYTHTKDTVIIIDDVNKT